MQFTKYIKIDCKILDPLFQNAVLNLDMICQLGKRH